MEIPLLNTKLFIPIPKQNLVPRPRLRGELDAALEAGQQLVFVVASAGYGKTSLVASWAAETATPVAWVSLDERDNEPEQFLFYLVNSLETVGISISSKFKETLKLKTNVPIRKLLQTLIPYIENFSQEFVLAFDDFHMITNPEIIQGLCEFVSDIPDNMHLFILSRTVPDIPCAKLNLQNAVLNIDETDLRFTLDEIRQFYQNEKEDLLELDEIKMIEDRTEGWVTALQLISLAIKNQKDVHQFLYTISSINQTIELFLVEEVLERLDADVKRFLLDTAQLDRFSIPLVDTILDDDIDGARLLEVVQENKLFLIPLDDTETWFRYHHLFAELLRSRMLDQEPARVRKIHLKAADWFRKHHYWADAIQHTLTAQKFAQAEQDIESIMHQYWRVGETSKLLSWIEALPEENIHKNPNIRLFLSWVQFQNGDISQGIKSLNEIKECLEFHNCTRELSKNEIRQIKAVIAAQEAAYNCTFGSPKTALRMANLALKTMSSEAKMWLGISLNAKGVAYRGMGMCHQAIREFKKAAETHKQNKNIYGMIVALSSLARQYYDMGKLNQVYEVCQQAIESIQQYDQQFIPLGIIYMKLAKVYLAWGDFEQAERTLYTCIDIFIEDGDMEYLLESYYQLARLRFVISGLDKAIDTIQQAARIISEKRPPVLLAVRLRAYQARLLALGGELDRAAVLMNTMDLNEEDQNRFNSAKNELSVGRVTAYVIASNVRAYSLKFERLTQSLILYKQGFQRQAMALIRASEEAYPPRECSPFQLDTILLEAVIHAEMGEMEEGLEKLRQALTWSQPNGHLFNYLEIGGHMLELLSLLQEREKEYTEGGLEQVNRIVYLNKLIAAFQLNPNATKSLNEHAELTMNGMAISLTNREEKVLQLLAKGYTYQEIGERLLVTENTVRTHIRGLYGKLDVNNRVLAITKAGELGLIKESLRM